ncbi:MAG: type 4a pilus biogenesis protein PilO [Deltaproteobacteria bacterium]|nr:type 4a pilus biogenesis protein PilO [Deltaproteobacteria bacterium]
MAIETNFDFDEVVEKLAKVPKPARMGAVAAIILGVLAGYHFLIYQEKHEHLVNLQGQAEELQRKLNKVRVVASNLDEFGAEVAKLERSLTLVVKQLPSKKQFEDLLRDISTAGKKVGVSIKSIERIDEVNHNFYAEVPFKLELEGEYHDVAKFFEQMAALHRIVNMGAMEIKVAGESDVGTTLRIKGTATTFRFIEGKG